MDIDHVLDHICLPVKDLKQSTEFYSACLGPLGIKVLFEFENYVGFGISERAKFWIFSGEKLGSIHLAFAASDREKVDQFYSEAIKAGAKDNGLPGVREQYHPNYYGGFVIDPDGHNIEAVCHFV